MATNFSFNFDDDEANDNPTEPQSSSHYTNTINEVLAQSSIPSKISKVIVKSQQQIDQVLPPEFIMTYPPLSLESTKIIYEHNFIPQVNPGVYVIYAPKLPKKIAKKTTQLPKKGPNKKKGTATAVANAITAKKKSSIRTNEPKQSTEIQPPIQPQSNNTDLTEFASNASISSISSAPSSIPDWIISLEELDDDDFESELPDIMIDPESYMLSIPNPTNLPRNIFVSITAPLRCITKDGALLETSYGLRKYRPQDDDFLLPSSNNNNNDNKKTNNDELSIVNTQCFCSSTETENSNVTTTPILHESTTFVIVLPPKSICDLCYIVTSIFEKDFISQRLGLDVLSKHIKTSFIDNIDGLLSHLMRPISTPALLSQQGIDQSNMPLDIAGRYITSHISSSNPNINSNTDNLPQFIPVFASPLPQDTSYLISQSSHGIMTHNLPQTSHAVDFIMTSGTPIYAPCDGVIKDLRNTSCSVGSHTTNLFDWNSLTIQTFVNHVILPYTKSSTNNTTIITTKEQKFIYSPISSSDSTHYVPMTPSASLNQQLSQPIYIDLVHLSKILVQTGQVVKCGDLIAFSGAAGFAPCPHLHMQVTLDNSRQAISIPFTLMPKQAYIKKSEYNTQETENDNKNVILETINNSQVQHFPILQAGYAINENCQLIALQEHLQNTKKNDTNLAASKNITLKTLYNPTVNQAINNKKPIPNKSLFSSDPSRLQCFHPDLGLCELKIYKKNQTK